MLVDRCSTMCLCFVLAMFYPKWALFFQLWAAIDVASHWLHLHAYIYILILFIDFLMI